MTRQVDDWHAKLARLQKEIAEKQGLAQLESFISRLKTIQDAPQKR